MIPGAYSRAVATAPRVPVSAAASAQAPAIRLGVEERGGVWCVVAPDGEALAPCSSERLARDHAVFLARLPSLSRP